MIQISMERRKNEGWQGGEGRKIQDKMALNKYLFWIALCKIKLELTVQQY